MVPRNLLKKNKTIEDWVEIIEQKFFHLNINNCVQYITEYLCLDKKRVGADIREAFIVFMGKKFGVLTFEDACNKLNIPNQLPDVSSFPPKYRNKQIALYKLTIIIEALNDGWQPNWEDLMEHKYWNWFSMDGGFSYYSPRYRSTNTSVPSALCFKTENIAQYTSLRFIDLYKQLYE